MATDLEKYADGTEVHPMCGVPNGHVDHNGETIVYEYDDEGNYLGWGKLPPKEKK